LQLSIIIVNYNVCYFLEHCLHSVLQAIKNVDAEVFVVDNNSVDDSVAMVKEKFSTVKLIENKNNTGFSFANNQAIKQSNGKYILLLNPDTVVEEDTFSKIIEFMETHENAGGLGVKMIDGKGNFLPESKRGLPTPRVAFYKIFGLSALFPKSKIFGKYHLGFLDKNKTHEVEILSGAFMLLRKSALDKIGLLDEEFFMYGEDIDLSYRLIKEGYKNYYFSETRIIHYKGESTKKSSVNYVFVFYRAMVIFARKHFSQGNAKTFSFLINIAIYLRAAIAVCTRFVKRILLPIIDAVFIFATLYSISIFWQRFAKHANNEFFEPRFYKFILPAYTLIYILSGVFNGAYDKPIKIFNTIKSFIIGSFGILVLYALLPESARYSRAVILVSAPIIILVCSMARVLLSRLKCKEFELENQKNNRFAIVGNEAEATRVADVLSKTSVVPNEILFVNPDVNENQSKFFKGSLHQLKDIVEIHKIDEIIFCAANLSSNQIINFMALLGSTNIDFKIAPPQSLYIIGSNSLNTAGDLYIIDFKTITKPSNIRNKRALDILASIILLSLSPLIILFIAQKANFLINVFNVLIGKLSWVGYAPTTTNNRLPKIKKAVLSPADAIVNEKYDEETLRMMNEHYAKNYSALNDLQIITKAFKKLGNQE